MKQLEEWASQALNQVLETMFYATAEPREKSEPTEIAYQGSVDLHGQRRGVLTVQLSQRLAQMLAASFCGATADTLSEPELRDVVQELTNMVAGSFVSLADPSMGVISISIPRVTRVSEQGSSEDAPSHQVSLEYEVEEEDLALRVSVEEG